MDVVFFYTNDLPPRRDVKLMQSNYRLVRWCRIVAQVRPRLETPTLICVLSLSSHQTHPTRKHLSTHIHLCIYSNGIYLEMRAVFSALGHMDVAFGAEQSLETLSIRDEAVREDECGRPKLGQRPTAEFRCARDLSCQQNESKWKSLVPLISPEIIMIRHHATHTNGCIGAEKPCVCSLLWEFMCAAALLFDAANWAPFFILVV